ncbi:MAG: FAD-binding oxidoreductase [Kiritimatiellia bacterium]|nr:FAD-binding oxidoreductase [Kiritimatiellia bacterium]
MKTRVTNWGNYPVAEAEVFSLRREDELRRRLAGARGVIARGMGRCYGDSSLADWIVDTRPYNRILSFDAVRGIVRCEAGVTIADLLEVFLPRGWFPPVTPGTKYVSIGGAIASDVHGKGPGSFCDHVLEFRLLTADGEARTCSRTESPERFETTRGGMGLTGVILEATLQLMPVETACIREQVTSCPDLESVMASFQSASANRYSVAWIDCVARGRRMGRGILMSGDHLPQADLSARARRHPPLNPPAGRRFQVPFFFPNLALNPWTIRAFNQAYVWANPTRQRVVGTEAFFYPLDFVDDWNRIYGRRGFTQYQFLLPPESCERGLPEMLERIVKFGAGSFLAVLKKFSPQETFMSFPREGFFLALDFPLSPALFPLLDDLDRRLLELGGRLYLAKDARMKPETFFGGYPNAREFQRRIREWDPEARFQSHQSRRLGLHEGGSGGS